MSEEVEKIKTAIKAYSKTHELIRTQMDSMEVLRTVEHLQEIAHDLVENCTCSTCQAFNDLREELQRPSQP